MSVYEWAISDIDDNSEYLDTVNKALSAGLSVVNRSFRSNHDDLELVRTFVLYDTESWRIPAFVLIMRLLADSRYRWSDELERIVSWLLGYTDQQIEAWQAYQRRKRVGWSGQTIYFLVSNEDREAISDVGDRCFPPALRGECLEIFFASGHLIPRSDAHRIASLGNLQIGRVAVRQSLFKEIFKGKEVQTGMLGPISGRLVVESLRDINSRLCSKIEFLSDSGWE
jgi:hypothetical protein